MSEILPPVAYLLDLDGTLYAGGAAVPGAPQTLDRLRREGTPFRLVTNTTSRSRAMRALNSSPTMAARIPGTLLAAMDMPIPVPHTSTPSRSEPAATSRASCSA